MADADIFRSDYIGFVINVFFRILRHFDFLYFALFEINIQDGGSGAMFLCGLYFMDFGE